MEGPKPHVIGITQQLTGGEFRLREEQIKGEYRHLQKVKVELCGPMDRRARTISTGNCGRFGTF